MVLLRHTHPLIGTLGAPRRQRVNRDDFPWELRFKQLATDNTDNGGSTVRGAHTWYRAHNSKVLRKRAPFMNVTMHCFSILVYFFLRRDFILRKQKGASSGSDIALVFLYAHA